MGGWPVRCSPCWLTLAVLAYVGTPSGLSAQTGLRGSVRDSATGQPIAGAEIRVDALDRRSVSNAQGSYTLPDLPGGRHDLIVRALGYRPVVVSVAIESGQVLERDFVLAGDAVQLDSVVVTGRPSTRGVGAWGYEAFEERRRTRPGGIFIDSLDMRRNEALDLRGVLRRMNVPMDRGGNAVVGRAAIRSFRQPNMDCPVAVYVDGVRVQLFRLRDYTAASIRAIEVYRSVAQTPPQFDRLDQECGVMLIWTRR